MPRKLKLDRTGKKSTKRKQNVEIEDMDQLSLAANAEVNDEEDDPDLLIIIEVVDALINNVVRVRHEFLEEELKWGIELKMYDGHRKALKDYNALSFATRTLPADAQAYACMEVNRLYMM